MDQAVHTRDGRLVYHLEAVIAQEVQYSVAEAVHQALIPPRHSAVEEEEEVLLVEVAAVVHHPEEAVAEDADDNPKIN